MNDRIAIAAILLTLVAGPAAAQSAATSRKTASIRPEAMRKTVAFLASKELKGRRVGTPENRRTAEWIAKRFAALGLQKVVKGSWFHEFDAGRYSGRNVVGVVRAPKPAREFIVVGAHFDGVGDAGGKHRPAADDNASGVSAMLEIARLVVARKKELKRHVVFASYDSEEVGLIGSTKFVAEEVIPPEDTVFSVVFDLIGGKFFPWHPKMCIAMGTEHSERVRASLRAVSKDSPTPIRELGTYVLEPAGPMLSRSDYRAFRQAKVPYVFFSTGTPWYYHMPGDTIERLDFGQMSEVATVALELVMDLADDTDPVDFINRPKAEVEDLRQLKFVVDGILEHKSAVRVPKNTFKQLERANDAMKRAIAKDKASTILAHKTLMLVFQCAKRSKPEQK